jgi:hypothetical protein
MSQKIAIERVDHIGIQLCGASGGGFWSLTDANAARLQIANIWYSQ